MKPPSATKIQLFTRDIYRITEWRDGCVYKTEKVGQAMMMMSHPPIRPGYGMGVPK